MGRVGRALLIIVLTAVAIGGIAATNLFGGEGGGKSFHFPRVKIDAEVLPDGSLSLKERRTFDFRGQFRGAFFTIDPTHAPVTYIEDFTIREGSTEIPYERGFSDRGGFKATWFFSAQDEQRTFTISYRVRCAVDVYDDAAHLNWQFIGRDWGEPTDLAEISLRLPPKAERVQRPDFCAGPEFDAVLGERPKIGRTTRLSLDEVRAWGHGPLSGRVRNGGDLIVFTVRDLDPGQFVEGSVLFPASSVPLMAKQPGGPGRQRILAEEQRLADQANATRQRHETLTGLTKVLWWLVPLLFLALVALAYRRDRVPGVPRSLDEPPRDTHPVKLALMWNTFAKRLGARDAYRAQFMHLVQEGVIELQAEGTVSDPVDIRLRRRGEPEEGMDEAFTEYLFAGEESPTLGGIDAKGDRKELLSEWWKVVGKKTKRTIGKISSGKSRLESWLIGLLAIATGAYSLWAWTGFIDGFEPYGIVGRDAAWLLPVAIVGWVVSATALRPYPPESVRRQLAEWRAFRRFLRTFSTLEDAPTLAVIVWEKYLVYAVALGVADKVEKQVRAILPEEALAEISPDNVPDTWHHWSTNVTHQPAYVAAGAAAAVGWSSGFGGSSSGSGGGGGFSGGGGGGGGGTGGGAF